MIAIEQLRRDPDTVRKALESRGEPDQVDEILQLDAAWRHDRTQADEIRNKRNQVNREIGHARSAGQPPSPEVIEEMRTLGRQVDELEASAQDAEERIHQMLLGLPNLPLPDVPVGSDAEDNPIYREEGEPTELGFEGLPHWELGREAGHHRLPAGGQVVWQPLLHHGRCWGPAGASPHFLDAGSAH